MKIMDMDVELPAELEDLTPEQLAAEREAAQLVARFTRNGEADADGSDAVRVAAFNSFI